MKLCIALGCGRITYNDSKASALGYLREVVYQKIAAQSKRRSSGSAWPLSLPTAQRVLLTASLASEPAALPAEPALLDADLFIVNGVIAELSSVLQDISTMAESSDQPRLITATQEVALSLYDARIFLAAFARLPIEEQTSSLTSLLATVDKKVAQMLTGSLAIIVGGSFVARVTTLCVNTYLMIVFGVHIRGALNLVLGDSLTLTSHPPLLRGRSEWYFPDSCYMGVFGDWEDSALPSFQFSPVSVDPKLSGILQRVLENALALGYATASTDKCHLLYAAWNALGKRDLWNDISTNIIEFTALPNNLSCLILQLRGEMCLVQRKVKGVHGERVRSTTLIRAIEVKEKANSLQTSAVEVNGLLRGMIRKASKLVDALLRKFVPSDVSIDQNIPPEIFCLLEACAVYLSFAVSSYTKSSRDFFSSTLLSMTSRTRNRARGYSTDSDAMLSKGGSVGSHDEADTLERLQDVCECLGAVPAYPDWLDNSCRLLESVSNAEAAEAAHEALVCLTKLISFGLVQNQLLTRRAFTNLNESKDDAGIAALATRLCWLNHYETDESIMGESLYVNKREYKSDIGELCKVDPSFLDILLSEAAGAGRHGAKAAWCPHSAQRMPGRFQDLFRAQLVSEVESPELRASEEWEILLAETLTSACVNVESGKRNAEVCDHVYSLVARAERWVGVFWRALDSLVPTAALLRFGLTSSGRASHPLSFAETTTDNFESNKRAVVEEMPRDITASTAIKDSVVLTLATIARLPPGPTCDAVAAHLMVDAASFATLQGMMASANVLRALAILQDILDAENGTTAVIPFFVARAAAILEKYGSDDQGDDSTNPRNLSRLYACLRGKGASPRLRFSTFLSQDVDPASALSNAIIFDNSDSAPDDWCWDGPKDRLVLCLLSFIWHDCLKTHVKTRGFFARAISSLVAMEFYSGADHTSTVFELLSPIIEVFNDVSEDVIVNLILDDICGIPLSTDLALTQTSLVHPPGIQESLCILLAFLLASRGGCAEFKRDALVVSTLRTSFDLWNQRDARRRGSVINLTLLYATRSGNLHGIAGKLFEDLTLKQKSNLDDSTAFENVKLFADFLEELRIVLSKRSSSSGGSQPNTGSMAIALRLPASCSYAIERDFHEQHWYNCYTCGLTNDKGCCALCAIVCHQGHDVAYSRYSSFFCDCGGGDDETTSSGSLQKCKCLNPQARDKFLKRMRSGDHEARERRGCGTIPTLSAPLCALIVKSSFAKDGQSAMVGLNDKGRSAAWVRFLYECAKKRFDSWKSISSETSIFASEHDHFVSYGLLSSKMKSAKIITSSLSLLFPKTFSLLGASQSGSFQVKMSTDDSIEKVKRNRLSNNGLSRSAMDADSRGRIVVGEPHGLVFCSALPFLNSQSINFDPEKIFLRSSLCTLGSVPIGIRVVGLKFSRDNENLICAWGTNDAKVILMNRGLDTVDASMSLDLGLSSDEEGSDIVLNSQWIPGSGTCLVVGCSQYLSIFDVTHLEKCVPPSATISSASCNSKIRDFAIVRISAYETEDDRFDEHEQIWKIFVLLDNGKIHESAIKQGQDGRISVDSALDPIHFINLSKLSPDADSLGSAASLPGEISDPGASLTYLEQSNILLCGTRATGIVAMHLDEMGQPRSTFELLPFKIPSILFDSIEECSMTGPYTHWKELGIVCRGSEHFFRVSCAGVSATANAPVLLCLEFNDSGVNVQEISKNTGGWFESPQLFDGSAVFSAPYLCSESNPSNLSGDKVFVERVVLCALALNGCLQMYAEDVAAPAGAALAKSCSVESFSWGSTVKQESGLTSLDQSLRMLAIEDLVNATHSKNVVFSAEGLGT